MGTLYTINETLLKIENYFKMSFLKLQKQGTCSDPFALLPVLYKFS